MNTNPRDGCSSGCKLEEKSFCLDGGDWQTCSCEGTWISTIVDADFTTIEFVFNKPLIRSYSGEVSRRLLQQVNCGSIFADNVLGSSSCYYNEEDGNSIEIELASDHDLLESGFLTVRGEALWFAGCDQTLEINRMLPYARFTITSKCAYNVA